MVKKKLQINSRKRHRYMLSVPEILWQTIKIMAEERDIPIRSMMVQLLRKGIEQEEVKEE